MRTYFTGLRNRKKIRSQFSLQTTKTTIWYPSSQQSSAANSPSRNRTPWMDGKEFVRQAR
ncbi:hypothetical protein YC2023_111935 [Brassica napus]